MGRRVGRQRPRRFRPGRTHHLDGTSEPRRYTTTLWISVVICAIGAVLTYVLPARGQKVAEGETENQTLRLEQTEGDAYLALDDKA